MEGIARPFLITQAIPAGGEYVIRVNHEHGRALGMEVNHPFFSEPVGVRMSVETAIYLRDALDSLIEEQTRGSVFADEAM